MILDSENTLGPGLQPDSSVPGSYRSMLPTTPFTYFHKSEPLDSHADKSSYATRPRIIVGSFQALERLSYTRLFSAKSIALFLDFLSIDRHCLSQRAEPEKTFKLKVFWITVATSCAFNFLVNMWIMFWRLTSKLFEKKDKSTVPKVYRR